MRELAKTGQDCSNCAGTCCTAIANSMHIDRNQALHIKNHLIEKDLWNAQLLDKLKLNITHYRLDKPSLGDGRRTFIRRTYTCPFFANRNLGCELPPSIKPLGCLAFNPKVPNQRDGGNCGTSNSELENAGLKNAPDNLPIPVALVNLFE
jgi:Fe-S-cluster containining protein